MKITLKCGCTGTLNKRKKTLAISYICEKHLAVIMKRVHEELWGELDWRKIAKQYDSYMKQYDTLHVPSNTLYWLHWLSEQRPKALRGELSYRGIPIVTSKPKGTQ
jgi:hypothetical protein